MRTGHSPFARNLKYLLESKKKGLPLFREFPPQEWEALIGKMPLEGLKRALTRERKELQQLQKRVDAQNRFAAKQGTLVYGKPIPMDPVSEALTMQIVVVELLKQELKKRKFMHKYAGADTSGPEQPQVAEMENHGGMGKRKGYRVEVKQWMKRMKVQKVDDAAARMGVSPDVLKSIMSDKGMPRYGKETLDHVLKKIIPKKA